MTKDAIFVLYIHVTMGKVIFIYKIYLSIKSLIPQKKLKKKKKKKKSNC